jgi:hypothetical protein
MEIADRHPRRRRWIHFLSPDRSTRRQAASLIRLLLRCWSTVADVGDLEAQGAEYASRAVYAAAEVVRTEWTAGRVMIGDAENSLGVVLFVIEDEQVGGGGTEMMACQEFVLP